MWNSWIIRAGFVFLILLGIFIVELVRGERPQHVQKKRKL